MGLRHFLYGNRKQKSKKKQSKNKLGEDSDPSSSVVVQRSGNHEEGGHKRIITDSRFSFVHSDPRFQNVPKHRAKVPIDSRFDRMFVDKNFSSSATLDKRGRPKVEKSTSSLRHYYRIEDENEKEREQEESENDQEGNEGITTGDKEEDEELKGENINLSLAGDDSSSELDKPESEEDAASSESEYEVDTDEDELDDAVYEEDVPIETVPEIEKETRRLAVVNMDWRYIKAEHLYMMLSSFLPKGGQILCVSVYPSEFGLQRMKEEEVHGPIGLFDEEEGKSDEEDGGEIDDEKLRAYELSRLRYYYAVVECDSVATADYLYKTCDGVEFERSSNVLDLRFIPDSMEFKHPPRDIATQAPGNYEAIDFHTSALQKSKIDLSWEEDEPQRVKKLKRKYDIDKDERDFKEFLASEESETDLENEDQSGKKQKIEHDYRALMLSGSGSDDDDEQGVQDMEVTFNSGLEDLSKRILEKKEKKSETVWESILRKKREKKKARKNKSAYSSEDDDSEFSDQETVEADDFFIEDPVVKRSQKEKEDKVQTGDKEAEASIAELELLLADGQDTNPGIKGFNLKPKKIKERKGNKVRKGKKAVDEEKIPTVDYDDPRFSALFVSPLYVLDPTDPQFKRSAAYARQMAQKQRKGDRQGLLESQQGKLFSPTDDPRTNKDDTQKSELLKSKKEKYELSSLVRSIKMKTKQGPAPTASKMDERDRQLRSVDEEAKQRDNPPGASKSIEKKHRHLEKDIKVR